MEAKDELAGSSEAILLGASNEFGPQELAHQNTILEKRKCVTILTIYASKRTVNQALIMDYILLIVRSQADSYPFLYEEVEGTGEPFRLRCNFPRVWEIEKCPTWLQFTTPLPAEECPQ